MSGATRWLMPAHWPDGPAWLRSTMLRCIASTNAPPAALALRATGAATAEVRRTRASTAPFRKWLLRRPATGLTVELRRGPRRRAVSATHEPSQERLNLVAPALRDWDEHPADAEGDR